MKRLKREEGRRRQNPEITVKIFIGLGNPGLRYSGTRHNMGHLVISELKKKNKPIEPIKKNYARGWVMDIAGQDAVAVKTTTFMNQSGIAVKKIFDRFRGDIEDYVIIHDDLDIPLGAIKLVCNKGPGGHNGVISVIEHLGSREFVRLRMGIDRQRVGDSYVDYVLSSFTREELPLVKQSVSKAALACEEIVKGGTLKAMSLYNV